MVMVHEIQDKRAKKALLGPSTKEGRGLKKSITRKKRQTRMMALRKKKMCLTCHLPGHLSCS
jgi:hypothetical protein